MTFGMALAALTLLPGFHALTDAANPELALALRQNPVTVAASHDECRLIFDPLARREPRRPCDVARRTLAELGVGYLHAELPAGSGAHVRVGAETIQAPDVGGLPREAGPPAIKVFAADVALAVARHGYPARADPERLDFWSTFVILLIFIIAASALYGPQAAWLVEMFPPRIWYSAMSLPLHIGGGWFGGFLPAIAFSLVAASGDIYGGLLWPVAIAAIGTVVTLLFVPETLEGRHIGRRTPRQGRQGRSSA
jgi:hypothetical protein